MGLGWGGTWKKCAALNAGKPCKNSRHVHKQHWLGNTWYYMDLGPKTTYKKKKKK